MSSRPRKAPLSQAVTDLVIPPKRREDQLQTIADALVLARLLRVRRV